MNGQHAVILASIFLFSLLLPIAIFTIREFVRDKRGQIAAEMAAQFPPLKNSHSFVFACAKYVSNREAAEPGAAKRWQFSAGGNLWLLGYAFPITTYVLVSFAGFYSAIELPVLTELPGYHFDNYTIYGIHAAGELVPAAHATYTADQLVHYGRGTIAVSVAAFLGAYLWTLIYLARRVTNFDLSPFSFLRATIQICLACFVAVFLRHLTDALPQLVWPGSSGAIPDGTAIGSWLLVLAFLVGFYPALGLNYLQERFAFLRFKSRSPETDVLSRELPLEMIDGIDSYIKFRLGEYEIEDAQNLALANPIQLFIETPYPLLKIIDWIGQAQLIIEVDNTKITELRKMGIRTSLDLLSFGRSEGGLKILQGILHPTHTDQTNNPMVSRLAAFEKKPHVQRLAEIIEILGCTATKDPKDEQGAIPLERMAAE